MSCLKTGCHIFLEEYHEYAYGDAFLLDEGIYLFRIVQVSREPIFDRLHFQVHSIQHWFDKNSQMSTMIGSAVNDLGYEGEEIG